MAANAIRIVLKRAFSLAIMACFMWSLADQLGSYEININVRDVRFARKLLAKRLTAAAFARLRAVVGFS